MSISALRRLLLCLCLVLACKKSEPGAPGLGEKAGAERCPARAKAPPELPNTPKALSQLSYWLTAFSPEQLDEVLLDVDTIAAHDIALRRSEESSPRAVDLSQPIDSELVRRELYQRLGLWEERFQAGEHALEKGDARALLKRASQAGFVEEHVLHVALAPISLHCAPFPDVLRSVKGDPRFDRNMCSQVRTQEPLEVLGRLGNMRLVRSAYALGFIGDDAALSPAIPTELTATYRSPHELSLLRPLAVSETKLQAGSILIDAGEGSAWIADKRGFTRSRPLRADEARATRRPLTRRAFLEEAFGYLGAPYGLGDENGGRDCSRLVLDVLRGFGLHLPRASVQQSSSGLYTIEIGAEASETERLGLLDEAAERGVVLLHFPGHIAFYLGRDQSGVPRLLHSFAEFLRPCPGGGETLFEVDRVALSDLSLGKHTSRRAFLERITKLTVFGKPPGQGLLAMSSFRKPVAPATPPTRCEERGDTALFVSPREPTSASRLRVIAVDEHEMRPAALWLFDPNGQRIDVQPHDLGVGPYVRWTEITAPGKGTWTALVADGDRTLACRRFQVRGAAPAPAQLQRLPETPAWRERHAWDRSMEALYSAFVEQLFAHPIDDMRTWSSLTELLHDPARNLLIDYLGLSEDAQISLSPDCADLPYFLRAYFAWKLGLPFAFRHCSRGRAGAPPHCGPASSEQTPVAASDDVTAFSSFMRQVGMGVHSASGRTLPSDPVTDLYAVALTREALRPGTVFVDPYGHLIIVAQWVPQGPNGQGMLLGADAQPDASIGRRRFWRGNFLFSPATDSVGAGFKAFRPLNRALPAAPVAANEKPREASEPSFAALGASEPSLEQYQGSADDFYTRMDKLIYPRPIGVGDRMLQLVNALDEQLKRRVEAIDLGEAHVRESGQVVSMPQGYAIFETEGAWEDFATPSRDMRLLIAIDAVLAFPKQVQTTPERFLASQADVERVPADLDSLLSARSFTYVRSDGEAQALTLKQAIERVTALELGYNPNDCVEWRWGAPEGSAELKSCTRRAPVPQRRDMERYRAWFHERTRPARP